MNLAILIGVSDYRDPGSRLPACKHDVELIASILEHSGKFGGLLVINDESTSLNIKRKMTEFINTYKNSGDIIEEIVFYYTGHGDLHGGDFYYLPADFDPKRRQQTGLANSELDAMLRSLSPSLTVKIIDACHSGVSYIKESDAIKKALGSSKGEFKKCYFMFSSQQQEVSFQDDRLSDFTRAFGTAILKHKESSIRYKDIVDAISDTFEAEGDQTPTFVIQADFTEVFCSIPNVMLEAVFRFVGSQVTSTSGTKSDGEGSGSLDLITQIKQEAKRYCSKEEALGVLNKIAQLVQGRAPNALVAELYEHSVDLLDKMDIPNPASIGKWLKDNKHEYFVNITYKNVKYVEYEMVPKQTYRGLGTLALSSFAGVYSGETERKEVTKTKSVVAGFKPSTETPYKAIRIAEHPKLQNLPLWNAFIVPVVSKVTIRLFYSFVAGREKSWGEWEMPSDIAWKTTEIEMKGNMLEDSILGVLENFYSAIITPLAEKHKSEAKGEVQEKGESTGESAPTTSPPRRGMMRKPPTKRE